jgi:hypothetical protein
VGTGMVDVMMPAVPVGKGDGEVNGEDAEEDEDAMEL